MKQKLFFTIIFCLLTSLSFSQYQLEVEKNTRLMGTVLFGEDTLGTGIKAFWVPSKGAFRAGATGTFSLKNWDYDSLGRYSFAANYDTKAKGRYSSAFGLQTNASGQYAFAWGEFSEATGSSSTAWGNRTSATDFNSTAWGNQTSATEYSATAWGIKSIASGEGATSWGGVTLASGTNATAWGDTSKATGNCASAWGKHSISSGYAGATAFGDHALANAYAMTALGTYNDTLPGYNAVAWQSDDPVFMVGNGQNEANRSTALTILKNGNIGIGKINPSHLMHLYENSTSEVNLLLENDGGNANVIIDGKRQPGLEFRTNGTKKCELGYNDPILSLNEYFFIEESGVITLASENRQIGILTIDPKFDLHCNGSAGKPGGGVWADASDRRLKQDVTPFADGLELLNKINPVWYSFNGKAGLPKNKRFIGVIAQEVQQVAPYMVGEFVHRDSVGNEETYLSYDGTALIYMLVNAVKELDEEVTLLRQGYDGQGRQRTENRALESEVAELIIDNGQLMIKGEELGERVESLEREVAGCRLRVGRVEELTIDNGQLIIKGEELEGEVKGLKSENEQLKSRIERLEALVNQLVAQPAGGEKSYSQIVLLQGQGAKLFQNKPNPFNNETVIEYFIPETVKHAQLRIADQNGRLLRLVQIDNRGKGEVVVKTKDLADGVFYYSLMLDEVLFDTKQMILAK